MTNVSESDRLYDYVFHVETVSVKGVNKEPAPEPFALHQNYPNPFNNVTAIPYTIVDKSHVTLEVRNIQGVTVARLVDKMLYPGSYTASFDASSFSSGAYFAVLKSGNSILTKKMTFMK